MAKAKTQSIVLELTSKETDALRHMLSYLSIENLTDDKSCDLERELLNICSALNEAGFNVPDIPEKKIHLLKYVP